MHVRPRAQWLHKIATQSYRGVLFAILTLGLLYATYALSSHHSFGPSPSLLALTIQGTFGQE
jgi:hypothetical protein